MLWWAIVEIPTGRKYMYFPYTPDLAEGQGKKSMVLSRKRCSVWRSEGTPVTSFAPVQFIGPTTWHCHAQASVTIRFDDGRKCRNIVDATAGVCLSWVVRRWWANRPCRQPLDLTRKFNINFSRAPAPILYRISPIFRQLVMVGDLATPCGGSGTSLVHPFGLWTVTVPGTAVNTMYIPLRPFVYACHVPAQHEVPTRSTEKAGSLCRPRHLNKDLPFEARCLFQQPQTAVSLSDSGGDPAQFVCDPVPRIRRELPSFFLNGWAPKLCPATTLRRRPARGCTVYPHLIVSDN